MMEALDQQIRSRAEDLRNLSPQEIIERALATYSPAISIAFSGAEDVVLIDMASKSGRPFRVFCLDTGRLHSETYRFLETVRDHYKIEIDVLFPQPVAVEQLVREKGLFSFYRDGHKECCGIRKVEPLRRALADLNAWITGQRKDQSPSTRMDVPVVQVDLTFSSNGKQLIKFNPLSGWTSKQVWNYVRQYKVPYNSLHERGYVSIGCEPCTRPILPNQHEREGRWWWEEETKKECGLHAGNVSEF